MAGTRTPFFANKTPGGVLAIENGNTFTGTRFFVHSGTGTNAAGGGFSPDVPLASIDYAVGLCTANKGDVIYVMPGHAETVSAAAGLDLDVAGITIIGIGTGSLQPTVTLDTANTADIDVDAANITVENIRFHANFLDIAAAIDVNADDFTLRRCRFTEEGADLNAKIWVQDAAAAGSDRITIEDCHCIATDSTNTHFVNFAGTGDGHIVRRNYLMGDWGTMCVGGAGVVTNAIVVENYIQNAATDIDSCINFAATATGICSRNIAFGGAAQANGITAQGMAKAENFYGVNAEDLQGILDPIVT